jgi:chitodextrinase
LSAVSAQLQWTAATDNVGVTGYQVVRNGSALPGVITGTSFTDTGLTGGTTYTYTVRALDAAGNLGPASDPAQATTPATNPVAFADSWSTADGVAWQPAWTTGAVSGSATSVNGTGVLAFSDVTGAYSRAQLTAVPAQADGTALMSYQWNSTAASAFLSVYLRGSGGWQNTYRPKTGYGIQLQSNSATVVVQKNVNGTLSTVQSVTGAQQVTTGKQWLRLQVNGSTIQFKTWADGQPEPATWKAVNTDSTITGTGQLFVSLNRGGSTNVGAKSVGLDDLQLFSS